jgi:hypothetical protein
MVPVTDEEAEQVSQAQAGQDQIANCVTRRAFIFCCRH